jgi:SAM-dependent methyltransferase
MTDPVDQIRQAYARRNEGGLDARYSIWDREALFQRHSLERDLLSMLDRSGFRPLDDVDILDVRVANGAALPFEDDCFDLALAFTMFSSIPDGSLRSEVAAEMVRVLRPGGAVLWYDFWTNPVNDDVTALGLPEIERLFGRAPVDARRVTLAPPISRRLARFSVLACELVAAIPVLRSHWLALVRV